VSVYMLVRELVLWLISLFGCEHMRWRPLTKCVLDFVLYFYWFIRYRL